jgi:membrane protein DedA with SNARE-associated domain/rhodanese-related sulfurtransferase
MSSAPDLLAQYGLAVVFAWAFAVQAGAPAPAVPMLLGAGALSGTGRMDLAWAITAAVAATLTADVLWYYLGRFHGTRVLELVCRFSLDPDSLIRRAKERFVAHRLRYLVLAKFLPGANPLAAGLAGAVPIPLERFVLYAAAGAVLWAGVWLILGYLGADVIALIATDAARLGTPLVLTLAAALAVYLAYKFARRQRFLRHLQKARITPIELKRRLDAGNHPVIFDLRATLDIETMPYGIPGARWISPAALDEPHQLIHKDSEVVFYCAEPKEATSARMALLLARHGYRDVHPLKGGLEGWRQAGFAVEPLRMESPPETPRSASPIPAAQGASGRGPSSPTLSKD